jgi:23S rRNA G2445 N2-methylase RlmL
MILEEKNNVDSFDSLYDLVFSIKRKDYIKKESPTVIKAKSIKSDLSSTPTIQKISKKAIVDKLA